MLVYNIHMHQKMQLYVQLFLRITIKPEIFECSLFRNLSKFQIWENNWLQIFNKYCITTCSSSGTNTPKL